MSETPERITLRKIGAQILEQLNLEKGLGYTIKQFLLRPGRAVQEYFYENRKRYTKPFSFLLLTTALTTFLMVEFVLKKSGSSMEELTASPEWQRLPDLLKPGLRLISTMATKYFNLFYLSTLPSTVLASYLLFRKKQPYNLAEHLVINTYIFAIQSIFYLFTIPFMANEQQAVWTSLPVLLMVLYFIYAYLKIFRLTIWRGLLYCAIVYVLSQVINLFLMGLIVLVGMLFA